MTQVTVPMTHIRQTTAYITEINFIHLEESDQDAAARALTISARVMTQHPGFIALNILRSTDGSRICTYTQWQSVELLEAARLAAEIQDRTSFRKYAQDGSGTPRIYDLVYCNDRSSEGVSIISSEYTGTIFINEITTIPGAKQDRLLELVVANNEVQSLNTPGYRSANFHKSRDGLRTVNFSLWDSEEHLIQAITAMADCSATTRFLIA